MTQKPNRPQFELRIGGLHLTIQRLPVWLITAIAAGTSGVTAWWAKR
ncbi:hypothetical protein ACIRVF_33800 [Kitasatospora sp. NPDC101157]